METAIDSLPFVSILVPVYRAGDGLDACLRSLREQTFPAHQREILVIGNDSVPLAPREGVRTLHEPRPGSYSARNLGIVEAKGELLAFIDADCIADRNWLSRLVAAFGRAENCGGVGGRICLGRAATKEALPFFQQVTFDQKRLVERWGFAATANLLTSREVVEKVGLFNADLKSGGDFEWGQRIAQAGLTLLYCAHAKVTHAPRESFGQLAQQHRRLAGGYYELILKNRSPRLEPKAFALALLNGMFPSSEALARALYTDKELPLATRLKVIGVAAGLAVIRTAEFIRLGRGEAPRRA